MRKIITAFMMMLCAVCMASAANYLTFTAEEDGSTFGIVNNKNTPDVQYSLDDGATWTALTEGDSVILAHKGDKALLKGNNPQGFSNRDNYSSFTMTGKVAASGSVMSLIDGVGLSAEIPKEFCFNSLFKGCASLTNAPKLPAETLAEECYSYMFSGCIGLTQAPELPATNLQSRCYRSMFSGCTSLTQAPELPATLMENYCYESMFLGCTSLTQAPKLPATTLAYLCYRNMFSGCTSLTQAPVLPATTLTYLCYDYMFYGCTNLSEIIVSFDVWSDNADKWVKDVAPTGTFICPKALPLRYGESMVPEGWTVIYVEDINYLTFTAEEDGSSFGIVNNGYNNPDLQYSLDGGETWNALAAGDTITLAHKGDKALLRGDNPEGFSKGHGVYSSFTMTGKIAASGSVMSLNDGVGISTEVPGNFCFYKLFQGCTCLTQAPELPATILKDYCYADMFSGCTSLTEVPELPATALIDNCYNSMFKNCTGLTRAYLLFVDMSLNVRLRCLSEMFSGCTNLSEISVVFDEWIGYTQYWVYNVAPTGTFYCPKALPLEYGVDRIPEGWTVKYIDDTVAAETNYLTFTAEEDGSSFGIVNNGGNNPDVQYSLDGGKTWTALSGGEMVTLTHKGDKALLRGDNPEGFSKDWRQYSAFKMTGKVAASGSVMSLIDGLGLSTEILWEKCFVDLFENCTSLTQAPELPATVLSTYCYDGMFSGCTSLTQAPELPATTLAEGCYGGMFYHCTSLTQAPELPATTLAEGCYYEMFSGCTNLSEIKVSFDDWNDGDYTLEWVLAVAPTGTFICPKDLPLVYRPEGIPEGWTVKYIDDTVAAEPNYLTFTAEEDSSTFGIVNINNNNPDVQYSLDGGKTWTALAEGDTVVLAHKGDKALLKGNNPEGFSFSKWDNSSFRMTGKVAASGSVMSLIDGVGISTEVPGNFCFYKLFEGCTSLTQAPELPATILADNCYWGMFYHCTSLTQAPELPATMLAEGCYYEMFSGCTSLSEIKVPFDDWNHGDYTAEWVIDVAPTGTFICPKALPLEYGWESIPEGWTVKYIDDTVAAETNYLTFTAEEDSSTFRIVNNKNTPDVQYSLDGGETWTALAAGDTITLAHKGDKALLRGDNPEGFSKDGNQYSTFKMTGKVAASGSVMSLIDGTGLSTEIPGNYCFYSLFSGCTGLTQTPELPAMTLANYCYGYMFSGCTSLTQAPKLPATTLAVGCYSFMFSGCTSLTQAPELPATTLAEDCYSFMFSGCTGLTQAPKLPATTLADACYYEMFSGCTSLTQAPELPATNLAASCYWRMFSGCTSLTQAPELPATTLAEDCYSFMFSGCTGLAQAPELPATTLAYGCYNGIFVGCESLSQIRVSFDEWSYAFTGDWAVRVAPTGTFICPKALPLEYGESRIPEGWTVKYIEDMPNYLTFTAEEDGSSFGIVNKDNNPDVQYSLDGGATWIALAEGDTVVLAHKGDKALLKGNNPEGFSKDWRQYSAFKMTGKVAASGSVMSLIDGVGISTEVPGNLCFYKLFEGCTSLTQAPELPATTLAYSCYRNMFEGCTSLTQAPKLPATTLAEACYFGMFSSCTSLTQAPELPATTLPTTSNVENGCYSCMFEFCTSLTQAPELPATTLAEGCYTGMFYACTSLTQAPKLPATTLADFCYTDMFYACTSLTQAPELPATTLTDFCYDRMFFGCTSLTQAPELPAKEFLGKYSYSGMFSGCTSLSKINVSFATWSDYYSNTSLWTQNVAPTGTFICPKALPLEYGVNRIPEGWTVKYIEDTVAVETNYLTFTAEEDGSSFGIVNNGKNNPDIQYSLDGGETWTALAAGDTVTLAHKGDKALLRGDNPEGFSKDTKKYSSFTMTGKIAASGSVMSLIDGMGKTLVVPAGDCFYSLFKGCTSLTQAPELPATTLAERCYNGMFSGCTSLTEAPELPAMTLANSCYSSMFYDCSSLTQAPELLATTLTESCYRAMFYGCTSLTQAPELPATTLAEYCYYDMFYGCTSLTQAPELPATTLADDCYNSMFRCCTSLTQAPELPATTLDRGCYAGMFQDCTSLTQAPELPATSLSNSCYNSMFRGCTSLTQAPELPATTLASSCYEFMFSGCTSLTQAPELPATSLSNYCYVAMFLGCTSLTEAPKLPATTLAGGCYNSMFLGCTSLTEAPKLPATTLAEECYNSMFRGCTSLTQAPELPATTLAEACYSQMFASCTSLTQAPELPAPELIAHSNAEIACYREMFSGCTNLSEISVAFVEWGTSIFPSDENTYRWVKDVAPTGTFICPKTLPLEYGVNRIPEGWTVKYIEDGSGVNTTLADNISVWTDDLTIFVRGAEGEVSLYDMSGRRVSVSNSADEERALSVPDKGVYVVRTNNGTSDVLVR